jgi:hypothetical protein
MQSAGLVPAPHLILPRVLRVAALTGGSSNAAYVPDVAAIDGFGFSDR